MMGRRSGHFGIHHLQLLGISRKKFLLSGLKIRKLNPKAVNDVKIISGGKILENSKTVGQCQMPFHELQKGAITMHVVVQPAVAKTKAEKKIDEAERKSICSCSIL
ncbi:Membrane-anchored ubiquitin-fold protein 3 [Bienertia sinuspersici]